MVLHSASLAQLWRDMGSGSEGSQIVVEKGPMRNIIDLRRANDGGRTNRGDSQFASDDSTDKRSKRFDGVDPSSLSGWT